MAPGAATGAIEADTETQVATDWIDRIGRDTVIAQTVSIVQRSSTVPSGPIVQAVGVTGRVGGALLPYPNEQTLQRMDVSGVAW